MATSVKQMMETANAAVPKITPAQAREMIDKGNTLVVDVRDAPEVEKSGKIAGAVHVSRGMLEFRANTLVVDVRDAPEVEKSGKIAGAVHVSRGMLEFRADPDSPYHDKNFAKDKTVILYCASGGRSALAAKVLKDMGFGQVYNVGAFKDWVESGGAIEKPTEPGA